MKSEVIYSALYSLVQVWAPITETDSNITIQNMATCTINSTIHRYYYPVTALSYITLTPIQPNKTNTSRHTENNTSITLHLTEVINHLSLFTSIDFSAKKLTREMLHILKDCLHVSWVVEINNLYHHYFCESQHMHFSERCAPDQSWNQMCKISVNITFYNMKGWISLCSLQSHFQSQAQCL